jgi:CIC family chloride channel protein
MKSTKGIFRKFFSFILVRLESLAIGEHLFMVLIAVIIGLLGGFGAILFRLLIKTFQLIFFGASSPELSYVFGLSWWQKLLIPAVGGAIVGPIVYYFAREVKGHGVPEVMEAVALKGGVIRPRVVLAKIVASAVSIASGGSVGREGPIVHIGAALSSSIGQMIKITGGRLRTLVGCGAAAGIAATFNAPIAGALFAVEIILSDFGVAQFSPIVISSVTATVISRHFLGNFPAFIVPKYELVSAFELLPYAIMGIFCGLVAVIFIRILYKFEDYFDSMSGWEPLRPALGGLIIGAIALLYPHIYGVGYETINETLNGSFTGGILALLLLLKLFATSVTLGSGGSGGVFAPSLFMGAVLGGFMGTYIHAFFPNATGTQGAYALVGMGAMVAGTTHAPITAIIMIFELTDDYHIILPLMAACILSTLFAMRMERNSIYTMKLLRRGINLRQSQDINILRAIRVSDVMFTETSAVHRSTPFREIFRTFINSHYSNLFVIDKEGRLSGVISFHNLRLILPDWNEIQNIVVAEDLLMPQRHLLTPDDTLDRAMHLFGRTGEDELPVVDSLESQKLLGFVNKGRVIEAYNREMLKRDTALDIHHGISTQVVESEYELTDGYILSTVKVPFAFAGKTLNELMIRNKFSVEVVLIRMGEKDRTILPNPSYRLREDDQILVIGQLEAVERLKSLG